MALDKTFPVGVTNGQIVVQFVAGGVDLPMVNAIQVSPTTVVALPPAIRVNAGGNAYTDASGVIRSADSFFTAGSTWSVANNITNTTTPELYQTCRYGGFSYVVPVPTGTYNVTLKFAEVSANGPGLRVFNVALNGAPVPSNFDIFTQAGGIFITLDKTFIASVNNGQIAIQFTSGSANLPMVNAIQISPSL